MPGYTDVGGVYLRIDASPDKLSEPVQPDDGKSGDIELTYVNYSCIPAKANIQGVRTLDRNVASAARTIGKLVSIPRRPNKRSARIPSTVGASIAKWTARKSGSTNIVAKIEIKTHSSVLGLVQPNTYVEVEP